ncbi:MAG TPA: hypothetical protein VFQ63_02530 [Patescibacteria group bacterium]|nr:hypothetical protein [Patescibacteria group bacterium]
MKKSLGVILVFFIVGGAYLLYSFSLQNSSYNGLPTVACIDATQPLKQNFTFRLAIQIKGENISIPSHIGYDNGKCLRSLYTNDATGEVYVNANDSTQFTLGNFFQTWKMTFNSHQLFSYSTDQSHKITVLVNGKEVTTYDSTPLHKGDIISISYE